MEKELLLFQTDTDQSYAGARVFKLKLELLRDETFKRQVWGMTVCNIFVIELLKQGLPHCRMLIRLADDDKPREVVYINQAVCAKIPDPIQKPLLHDLDVT